MDFFYTLCNKSKFLIPLSCCYISADNLLCLKSIRLHLSKVDGENSLPLTNKFQLDQGDKLLFHYLEIILTYR